MYDGDKQKTIQITLNTMFGPLKYDHAGEPMAFQVFNAEKAGIPFKSWEAHSGEQMLVSFSCASTDGGATKAQNDDWLISPEVDGAQTITFWAFSPNASYYGTKEQMPEMKAVALGFESVSDEETRSESAPGRYAVDGNENTFWHSRYSGGNVAYPHSITLSTDDRIDALTLMQRSTANNSASYDAASMVVYAGDDVEHMDSIATVRLPFYVESTLQLRSEEHTSELQSQR